MNRELIERWENEELKQALEELERLSGSPGFRELYEARFKQIHDQINLMHTN